MLIVEHTDRAYALAKGRVALEGPSGKLAKSPELREVYLGADQGAAPAGSASGNGATGAKPRARR